MSRTSIQKRDASTLGTWGPGQPRQSVARVPAAVHGNVDTPAGWSLHILPRVVEATRRPLALAASFRGRGRGRWDRSAKGDKSVEATKGQGTMEVRMSAGKYSTEQEEFWAGEFGDAYSVRNASSRARASALHKWSTILRSCPMVESVLELGANVGLNMEALRSLLPEASLTAIEINESAYRELAKLESVNAVHGSFLDVTPDRTFDLTFTSGVLIHIAPEALGQVYDKLYRCSNRFVVVAEYYNPVPVSLTYRGHENRLFKRDFAGDLLDRFPDLRLRDYGFFYRRDPNFPVDDVSWFLLEKT